MTPWPPPSAPPPPPPGAGRDAGAVLWFVVPILGAVAANRGEPYDPPLTVTFVRGA